MSNKYYGVAMIAAIGAAAWYFMRNGDEPAPDCTVDADCPTGYFCHNGVCVPESTDDFVVESIECGWDIYTPTMIYCEATVRNVGSVDGNYTAVLTGTDTSLSPVTKFIQAGVSSAFTWAWTPQNSGTWIACVESMCDTYMV